MRTCAARRRGFSVSVFAGLTISLLFAWSAMGAIPSTERTALIDLYNSTGGAGWTLATHWNNGVGSECTWYGVTCTAASPLHVIGLELGFNNLVGNVPDLSALTELATLFLDDNQLTGTLPPLAALTVLNSVDFSGNLLTSSVPDLTTLTALQYADFSRNQFDVSLPSLSGPASLQILILGSNQFAGSIPDPSGLTSLEYLDLSGNELSGAIPSGLGNLTALTALFLNGNMLSGNIPSSLLNLTNLLDGGSDIRWNALHTSDSGLAGFLSSKQSGGDWSSFQTVAPASAAASAVTPTAIAMTWTPIAYTSDAGFYQVLYSTVSGGLYTPYPVVTADKTVGGLTVMGLSAATTYYLVGQTTTKPNANNRNTVVSELSLEVSTATLSASGAPKFYTIVPCRLIDTRHPAGPYGGPALAGDGAQREFAVGGQCGVPADAVAVAVNVTVINPSGKGDLRTYPAGIAAPGVSEINFDAGSTRANNSILALTGSPGGSLTVQCDITGGTTNLLLDIDGYFR